MSAVDWEALRDAADLARKNAYAPYSGILVGSAVLAGGRIFSGCNVENSSFPVGSCAERGAIAAMVAAGERRIEALVVLSEKGIPPCGMCRQAIHEFGDDVPVRIYGDQGHRELNIQDLLPEPFRL